MKITGSEVLHVARLSRLKLNADELTRFQKDLNAILEYMDMLADIDTAGITASVHTTTAMNVMRPDTVRDSQELSETLANAPRHLHGTVVVPKVIE